MSLNLEVYVVRQCCAFLLAFSFVGAATAQNISVRTTALNDPPYNFEAKKLATAKDAFEFFRTFVDYFYLVAKDNEASFAILEPQNLRPTAVCVGDPHAENFGVLQQKDGTRIFTANDIDDSATAPVAADLFRLLVGARLVDSNIHVSELLDAYVDGLDAKISRPAPRAVEDLFAKSLQDGTGPADDHIDHGLLVREPASSSLTKDETSELTFLAGSFVDGFSYRKIGGGSHDQLRYEVLLKPTRTPSVLRLEFKEEGASAMAPFVTGPATTAARLLAALDATFAGSTDPLYKAVKVLRREMLQRPRYGSSIAAKLKKLSPNETHDLISYEAYTLARIHARTLSDVPGWQSVLKNANRIGWDSDVTAMTSFIETKYQSLP
ncbi:hypothetical protein BH10BDE1_BH10BDE1_33950 [soil metagenome]